MVSILGNRSLTDEVLKMTVCLVKQTLNARLITPACDDPENLEALTPNHFILGRVNVCILFFLMQKFIQTIARCFDPVKQMPTSSGKDGFENIFRRTMSDPSGTSLKQILRLQISFG